MDIKCRRTTCEFNKGHTCFSPSVKITNNAECKTFEKEETSLEELDLSKTMFKSAPEYENSRHIKNVALNCKASSCLFNHDGKCLANGITVVDQDEKSRCGTFIYDV